MLEGGSDGVHSYFAPARRAERAELDEYIEAAANNKVMTAVLGALGGIVVLLNPERQIVAVNAAALHLLHASDAQSLLGLRPGEALGCVNVPTAPGGCGTGKPCRDCGAAIACVLSQVESGSIERECLLTAERDGQRQSYEFRVRATRLEFGTYAYTLVVLQDIQDQKRRQNLERVFFHDLLNTVSALRSYTQLAKEADEQHRPGVMRELEELVTRLIDEVKTHRDLAIAERGDYRLQCRRVSAREALSEVLQLASGWDLSQDRSLVLGNTVETTLVTDPVLLGRVLSNMVKNALEAVSPGSEVRASCDADAQSVTFRIHNPGSIDERTAARIFQRSFSTKRGSGRGLGTYSMKLFGEQYLGGEVAFTSGAQGTEFTIRVPLGDAGHQSRLDSYG